MTTPNTQVAAATPNGPGSQLRQARLDLKLAPEDVANILRLSPKQIVALEDDDYGHLPGPTYVRGYLRSYAQLLGLAPEKIIEIYNQLPSAVAPVDLTKLTTPEQVTSKDYRVQLVTLTVAAILIGLSAIWWQGSEKEQSHPAAPVGPTQQLESEAGVSDVTLPPQLPPATTPATGTAAIPEPAKTQPPVSPAPAAPGAARTPAIVTAPAPTGTSATTPQASTVAPTGAPPAAAASGPRVRVTLHADQESWVDVRDANQNRLLYETLPAGRVVTLEGTSPLSVFLGNVDGVRVEFNGRPFDANRYKRGPVARFTLGEPAAGAN
jgi:cytoskeleton protein RodZ